MFSHKIRSFAGKKFKQIRTKHIPIVSSWAGLGPSPGWGPVRVGAHMGPYGPLWAHIWAHMGPYGPIWALMGPCGPLWAHMGPPEDSVNFT